MAMHPYMSKNTNCTKGVKHQRVFSDKIISSIPQGVGSVEVALLALYNMEVLDEQGQPRIAPFRLPTLARQSVFHEVRQKFSSVSHIYDKIRGFFFKVR